MSLKQNFAVKVLSGYVAATFVIMEILYLGVWCRPIQQYWAVPPDNSKHHGLASVQTRHSAYTRLSSMQCRYQPLDHQRRVQHLV